MHDLIISVAALLGQPGSSRPADLVLPVPEEFSFTLATFAEPVGFVGVMESVVDGILVRGRLTARAHLVCARCLDPVDDDLAADVAELYRDPARAVPDDELEEGYLISVEETIDLDALLRDTLAGALPTQPHCRADCAGLCARCGANRNREPCACPPEEPDPRWAALANLDLSR